MHFYFIISTGTEYIVRSARESQDLIQKVHINQAHVIILRALFVTPDYILSNQKCLLKFSAVEKQDLI